MGHWFLMLNKARYGGQGVLAKQTGTTVLCRVHSTGLTGLGFGFIEIALDRELFS
jgi:hypothetical protein